jgi:hypothetical protein
MGSRKKQRLQDCSGRKGIVQRDTYQQFKKGQNALRDNGQPLFYEIYERRTKHRLPV